MKPVIYLDVDGVLWAVSPDAPVIASHPEAHFRASEGCEDFIRWALAHCEVRWCTTWAMPGTISREGLERLAQHTRIPVEVWAQVQPSRGWGRDKTECIAWDEHRAGRPFAWIEDGLHPREMQMLRGNGFEDCYIHTDIFEDPLALVKAHRTLRERWGDDATEVLP